MKSVHSSKININLYSEMSLSPETSREEMAPTVKPLHEECSEISASLYQIKKIVEEVKEPEDFKNHWSSIYGLLQEYKVATTYPYEDLIALKSLSFVDKILNFQNYLEYVNKDLQNLEDTPGELNFFIRRNLAPLYYYKYLLQDLKGDEIKQADKKSKQFEDLKVVINTLASKIQKYMPVMPKYPILTNVKNLINVFQEFILQINLAKDSEQLKLKKVQVEQFEAIAKFFEENIKPLQGIIDQDDIELKTVTFNDLTTLRFYIDNLGYSASAFSRAWPTYSFIVAISQMLYLLDPVIKAKAFLGAPCGTPLDVQGALIFCKKATEQILATEHPCLSSFKEYLNRLKKFFTNFAELLRPIIEKDEVDNARRVMKEQFKYLFNLSGYLYSNKLYNESALFELGLIRFNAALTALNFKKKQVQFLNNEFEAKPSQYSTKSQFIFNEIGYNYFHAHVSTLIKYYINPSPTARSYAQAKQVEFCLRFNQEKQNDLYQTSINTIKNIIENIAQVDTSSYEGYHRAIKISEELSKQILYVDMVTHEKDQIPEQFKEMPKLFEEAANAVNSKLDEFMSTFIRPVNKLSIDELLLVIHAVLESIDEKTRNAADFNDDLTRNMAELESRLVVVSEHINKILSKQLSVLTQKKELEDDLSAVNNAFMNNNDMFDTNVREFYLSKISPFLMQSFEILLSHLSQFEDREYEPVEISEDLNNVTTAVLRLLEAELNERSIIHIRMVDAITIILHNLYSARTGVLIENPKQVLGLIDNLKQDLSLLWDDVNYFHSDMEQSTSNNAMYSAAWKIRHLNSDYVKDSDLHTELCAADELFQQVKEDERFGTFFTDCSTEIAPVIQKTSSKTSREGTETEEWGKLFVKIIEDINNNWYVPASLQFVDNYTKSCEHLNRALEILGKPQAKAGPFENSLEQVHTSQKGYIEYIEAASKIYGDRQFWAAVKDAATTQIPRDEDRIAKAIADLQRLTETEPESLQSNAKRPFAQDALFLLQVSKMTAFKQHDAFMKECITYLTAEEEEDALMANVCILMEQCQDLYEFAVPARVMIRIAVQQRLLQAYIDPQNTPYAPTYTTTKRYIRSITDEEEVQCFTEISKQLALCFFRKADPAAIDYVNGIEYLRRDLPPEMQLRKLSPDEERDIIFKTLPLMVVNDDVQTEQVNMNNSPHLYNFDNRALDTCTPTGKHLQVYIAPPLPMNVNKEPLLNEFFLPEEDKTHSPDYINTYKVAQLTLQIAKAGYVPELHFAKLGTVYQSDHTHTQIRGPVGKMQSSEHRYLKVDISSITVEGKVLEGMIVLLYIFDKALGIPVTQPCYLRVDGNGKPHPVNGSEHVYFQISKPRKDQILIMRLLHHSAADKVAFNLAIMSADKELPKREDLPCNFAISYMDVFDERLNLLENSKFPEDFHLVVNNKDLENDTSMTLALMQKPETKCSVAIDMTTSLSLGKPNDSVFTWMESVKPNTVLNSLLTEGQNALPLITLRNIQFTFQKPQDCKSVFFTAMLLDDDSDLKNPHPLRCAIDYNSNSLVEVYKSSCVTTSVNPRFSDVVQFYITRAPSTKAHILIQFWMKKEDGSTALYKISVVELYDFNDKMWASDSNTELPLFEQKKLNNNNYIPYKKPNQNSKFKFFFSMPRLFFLPECFVPVFNSGDDCGTDTIDISGLPKKDLLAAIVPVTARLLKNMSEKNIALLINIYAQWENQQELDATITSWLTNVYRPTKLGESIPKNLLFAYGTYISKLVLESNNTYRLHMLLNIIKTAPIILSIITATLAWNDRETDTLETIETEFVMLVKAFASLVSNFYNLEMIVPAHRAFAEMMFFTTPMFNHKFILSQIGIFLNFTSVTRFNATDLQPLFPPPDPKDKKPHTPPIPKPDVSSKTAEEICLTLKYNLFEIFFHSVNLVANIAVYGGEENIIGYLIDGIRRAFVLHDIDLIRSYIVMVAQLCRDLEQFSVILAQSAAALWQYIDLAIDVHSSIEINTNYLLCQHFVVPVLFIIHECDKKYLFDRLSEYSPAKLKDFFKFLKDCVEAILQPPSTKGLLATVRQSTITNEMKHLNEMKFESKDVNYALFNEITMRYLFFFIDSIRNSFNLLPAMEEACGLLLLLLNRLQEPSSIGKIIVIICHLVDKFRKDILTKHNNSLNQIIHHAIKLCKRHLRISRAGGAALILHIFFMEYMTTRHIIITSHYFFYNYTDLVLDSEHFHLKIFGTLLETLNLFSSNFHAMKSYVELLEERMAAARVVYDALIKLKSSNGSPEFKTEQMLRIADQFFTYPVLRLRWLHNIIKVNEDAKLWSSVFVTYIRIAHLVSVIVQRNTKERIPSLDFSFVPSSQEEEAVNIEYVDLKYRHLLIDNAEFTADGIINACEGAARAAKDRGLYLHHRHTLVQLVALYEMKRRFKLLTSTAAELSQMYGNFSRADEEPLSFYLLERRKNGQVMSKKLYVSPISNIDSFVKFLNDPQQFRFDHGEMAQNFPSFEAASKILNNTCVFTVKSRHSLLEYNCEQEFYCDEADKRHLFKTKLVFPSTLMCSPIESEEVTEISDAVKVREEITAHNDHIKQLAKSITLMLPSSEFANRFQEYRYAMPVSTLEKRINAASDPAFANRVESRLKLVREPALELAETLKSAASVYVTAATLLGENDEVAKNKMTCIVNYLKVVTQERTAMIDPMKLKEDPLNYKREYEDF